MPRRFYLLLTLATFVGAFLRLWRLTLVPPGLHYDLAATALLGNDVAFNGYRPLFIPAFTGHEALFYYWLALWFRLVGSSIFTLRLAAAALGILTLPAVFFAVREVLRFEEQSLSIAALATVLVAFAFFHVTFSRFGFRVITEPLIQSLALGFLFRGLHRTSNFLSQTSNLRSQLWSLKFGIWDLALSGLFTGLAAYTYLAARLFPVPLAVFWLAVFIGAFRVPPSATRHRFFRILLLGFGVFSFAASLAFAPLGYYFLTHPQDFFTRASQVAPRPGEWALIMQGLRRAAEMIFINGEPYDRYNLPGLPLLTPLLGPFFIIGLLITLRNLFKQWPNRPIAQSPNHREASLWDPITQASLLIRASELLLLMWLPAMLLPTALAVHEIFPSTIRAFGVTPLLFVFPARGLLAAYRWLQSKWPGPLIPHAYPVTILSLLILALGAFNTYQDYFITWANLPNQRLNNDADLTALADYLNARDPLADTALYVSAIHYRHPTLAYLARDFSSIHWLFGGLSLAIPQNQNALYLISRSTPLPGEWLTGWDSHLLTATADFRAYYFNAGETAPLPAFTPVNENFGNALFLTGYRVVTNTAPLYIDLRWRIENLIEQPDMLPYTRLSDLWGNQWTQSGGFNYPSEQWSPGDTLLTRLTIPLPPGMPPGSYAFKVGFYSESTRTRLPHLDLNGAYAGEIWTLPEVTLPPAASTSLADYLARYPMSTPAQSLDPVSPLALLGFTFTPTAPRQGERLQLTLHWHATAPISSDPLTIRLNDQPLYSGQPVHNTFPFSDWASGQLITDHYSLKIPADFPPGPADLTVNVEGHGASTLTTLDVIPVDRTFTPPAGVITTAYIFSNTIALYGYTLQPGPPTSLTLYWQSLAPLDSDYTLFIHVLDASGQIVAQSDAAPRAGAYPTSLWAPGEFISDAYTFNLQPGVDTLELGFYLTDSGERLPVFDSAHPLGDALTLPAFQIP